MAEERLSYTTTDLQSIPNNSLPKPQLKPANKSTSQLVHSYSTSISQLFISIQQYIGTQQFPESQLHEPIHQQQT